MIRNLIAAIFIGLLLGGQPIVVDAGLYKWVDDEGNVHYSDTPPGDDTESDIVTGPQSKSSFDSASKVRSGQPQIRPYDRQVRRLHVPEVRYLWKSASYSNKSTKIGVYHTGKGCTSRGAIKAPEVFLNHISLLPTELRLAEVTTNTINALDYESERTARDRLVARLRNTDGLSLHGEVIELELHTCAPSTRSDERLKRAESFKAHRFSKHRVRMLVHWQLKDDLDQSLVYETTTGGSFNGWKERMDADKAVGFALDSAVLALFSDRNFVAGIVLGPGESGFVEDQAQDEPAMADHVTLQAQLVQVITEINTIKVGSIQYYVNQGDWPRNPSDVGYHDSRFKHSKAIDYVDLRSDGSIVVELKPIFGRNKKITLTPEIGDRGLTMNSWNCRHNLNSQYLGWSCLRE